MTTTEIESSRERLRAAVRFMYDLQRLRIATLGRSDPKGGDAPPIELDPDDTAWLDRTGAGLRALEADALKTVDRHASRYGKIYDWLREQSGVGPTIAGFLLAEFDIHKADRPSDFWHFACLHVVDGHAPRPVAGEKLTWSRRVRSKCVFVLGGSFLKAEGGEGHPVYRKAYDDYRGRKETQLGTCFLCNGTGKAARPKKDAKTGKVASEAGKAVTCWNCVGNKEEATERAAWEAKCATVAEKDAARVADGKKPRRLPEPPAPRFGGATFTPDRAPWGRGAAHRHQASIRYAVRQFLADFWRQWRLADGLPVVPTWYEAHRGYGHGGSPAVEQE